MKGKPSCSPYAFFTDLATTLTGKVKSGNQPRQANQVNQANQNKRQAKAVKIAAKRGYQTRLNKPTANHRGVQKNKKGRGPKGNANAKSAKTHHGYPHDDADDADEDDAEGGCQGEGAVDMHDSDNDKQLYDMEESPESSEREVLLLADRARRAAEKKRKQRQKLLEAKDVGIVREMQRIAGEHSTALTQLAVAGANSIKRANNKSDRVFNTIGERIANAEVSCPFICLYDDLHHGLTSSSSDRLILVSDGFAIVAGQSVGNGWSNE